MKVFITSSYTLSSNRIIQILQILLFIYINVFDPFNFSPGTYNPGNVSLKSEPENFISKFPFDRLWYHWTERSDFKANRVTPDDRPPDAQNVRLSHTLNSL